jgi:hypothetical protein
MIGLLIRIGSAVVVVADLLTARASTSAASSAQVSTAAVNACVVANEAAYHCTVSTAIAA